jgi:hypothetical protein
VSFALAAVAIAGMMTLVASNAFAFSGFSQRCSNCHTGAGVAVTATLVSSNAAMATYSVAVTGGNEWAVFNGTVRVAGAPGTTGQFTVAVGPTYTVFAVDAPPENGGIAQTTVTPTAPVVTMFTITPSAGAGGAISPATPQTVASGDDASFMITADAGFHIADVLVDGTSVGAVGSYTFTNVTANHTIAASFAPDVAGMFTITPLQVEGGMISPSVAQVVAAGADVMFSITPDAGFHITDVHVDGVSVGAVSTYTFTNVQADHTIHAMFAPDSELVETHVAMRADHTSVRRRHTIRITGFISPEPEESVPIKFQVMKPGTGRWTSVSTRMTDDEGMWTASYRPTKRGTYRFRAVFKGDETLAPSISDTVKVRVR